MKMQPNPIDELRNPMEIAVVETGHDQTAYKYIIPILLNLMVKVKYLNIVSLNLSLSLTHRLLVL